VSNTKLAVGTIASLIAFAINFKATSAHVAVAIYVVFICLMAAGFFVALFTILPPKDIRRSDGTSIALYHHKRREIRKEKKATWWHISMHVT